MNPFPGISVYTLKDNETHWQHMNKYYSKREAASLLTMREGDESFVVFKHV